MPSSSAEKVKSLKTVRGKDIKIRYTQDDFEDALVNQRTYLDENGDSLTPITPLLLARQVGTPNPTIDRLGNSEPRYISACFGSPVNSSGESEFKVILPYAPGDTSHAEHIKEVFSYVSPSQFLDPKTPLSLSYHGENYNP
ncbi:hypothetical protein [Kamptonema sp. UHCC 0994]|uniref:hypothetical protein n=1 Tax=Kamptonema sp. UHCC 0994 TaxID=3031329 RepID=UPI0023B91997|nr:hypothetical protein [Kamptonema sp. UHCC 0994]MDF0553870.1 hypothetical protein [Kamptonema sp. UHCC 0994]